MAETYGINLDGKDYRVHVIFPSIVNSFEIREGPNSGAAQSGREIRDIIGTAYLYELQAEPDFEHPEDFDALFDALSAPVASHRVVLPFGQESIEFDAAVSSGKRTYHGYSAGYHRWKGLSISFRPIAPQRTE